MQDSHLYTDANFSFERFMSQPKAQGIQSFSFTVIFYFYRNSMKSNNFEPHRIGYHNIENRHIKIIVTELIRRRCKLCEKLPNQNLKQQYQQHAKKKNKKSK